MIQWLEAKTQCLQPRNKGNVSPSGTSSPGTTHSSKDISPETEVCPCWQLCCRNYGVQGCSLSPTGARLHSHNDYLALKIWDFTNGWLIEFVLCRGGESLPPLLPSNLKLICSHDSVSMSKWLHNIEAVTFVLIHFLYLMFIDFLWLLGGQTKDGGVKGRGK